jgi:hypothetical protein
VFKDIGDEELDEILAKPDVKHKRTTSVPGTNRRKKYDDSIRTVSNWFNNIPTTLDGICECPNHDEKRTPRDRPLSLLYVKENGMHICRWCFVESRDL